MNNRLKATLEEAIVKWADKHCEDGDWPDGWTYPNLYEDMAQAASLVFDANRKGQEFAKEQE